MHGKDGTAWTKSVIPTAPRTAAHSLQGQSNDSVVILTVFQEPPSGRSQMAATNVVAGHGLRCQSVQQPPMWMLPGRNGCAAAR